jgi:hypothetical protein
MALLLVLWSSEGHTKTILFQLINYILVPEVPKLSGASPGGRCWSSGGRGDIFVWGRYLFWTKYGYKIKICIFVDTLLGSNTYHLVTVLAPNYKQHVLIVDNHFTRQYIPEDNSEHHTRRRENLKSHISSTFWRRLKLEKYVIPSGTGLAQSV